MALAPVASWGGPLTAARFLEPLTMEERRVGAGCYGRDAAGQVYFVQEFSDEPAIIKVAGRLVRPRFPGDEFRFDGSVELRAVDTLVRFGRVARTSSRKAVRPARKAVRMSVAHRGLIDVRTLSMQCAD